MGRPVVAVLIAAALSACGPASFDELAYSVDVDGEKGVALFTCTASSSGHCILRFDGDARPATSTIAVNETGAVAGVGPGSSYCATTGASGMTCHGQTLQIGKQTIRRMKRRS